MEWDTLEKSMNNSVFLRFFAFTFYDLMDFQNRWSWGFLSLKAFLIFHKNFLDFKLDKIEKHSILNFHIYKSKGYTSIIKRSSGGAGRMKLFVHFSKVFYLYTTLYHQKSISSNFLVFHTSKVILFRSATFLLLIVLFFQYCIRFFLHSQILERFPRIFLKCSLHFWSLSSWQTALSFALKVLFLPFTLFTVCHAIHNCLSSSKFLILLIWPWIYSACSFWHILVLSGHS